MKKDKKEMSRCIIIADDDPDDQYMIKEALNAAGVNREIFSVHDGEELIDFLHRKGKFQGRELPRPAVILLDLNMPKKDGRECLKEIKSDPELRIIPVIIFSTSNNEDDITHSYECGASSYITKPYSYNDLLKMMQAFNQYWFNTAKTPGE